MQLDQYMRERRALVEAALARYLPSCSEPPGRLHEAMRYSVLAPGKRLRPVLVLASAEAAEGNAEAVIPTACALECIHAFSLIHDDLPCMDDDATRRGRPTNHMVFGEANALLAGDALLAFAFELIAGNAACLNGDPGGPGRVLAAVRLIARASGTWGMVGGQVADMEAEGRDIGPEALQYIHSHKTGALIEASAVVGALLVGGAQATIEGLGAYGRRLGLAFQIADDILDIVGDEGKIGKPVGSDQKQDKATYPKLFGIEESRKRASEEAALAVEALRDIGEPADPLRAIARYVVERDL